jgi:hypothetical protein
MEERATVMTNHGLQQIPGKLVRRIFIAELQRSTVTSMVLQIL